jgi:tripartite-type tricarboxylate transporter receptor subunit TctC
MRLFVVLLSLVGVLAIPAAAAEQSWPERPVHFVVPYPPGGNADVIARILANALQQKFGQPFIVDNKSGGGGTIGALAVARSAPDGYTFFFTANGPLLFAPELVKEHPYSWDKDFEPVSIVSSTPLVLLVSSKSSARNLDGFIDSARKSGEKMTFASAGMGSSNHLLSELMQRQLNVKWTTVQYRGTAPAMNDLIAGQVDFSIDQVNTAAPFIKAGSVRALAVSSKQRWPVLPNVPTMAELGYPKLIASTFTALMAPVGAPKQIIAKLSGGLAEVVRKPAVRQHIEAIGSHIEVMSPQESATFLGAESATWTPIVRELATKQ